MPDHRKNARSAELTLIHPTVKLVKPDAKGLVATDAARSC